MTEPQPWLVCWPPYWSMDATELGAKLTISGQYVVLKKDVTPAVKRTISKLNLGGIVYAELSNQRCTPTAL